MWGGFLRPLGAFVIIGGDICYKRRMQHAGRKKIVAGMLALALTIQGVPMQREQRCRQRARPRKQHPAGNGWSHHMETDGTDAAAGMVSGG